MKYFTLIVTSILLVALLATSAFGAAGKKSNKVELLGDTPVGELTRGQLENSRVSKTPVKGDEFVSTEIQEPSTYHFVPPARQVEGIEAAITPGTYTIPGNYASINAAAFALNTKGISGPVVFQLVGTVYNEAGFYIGQIPGSDAVNTVTFKPAVPGVIINLVANSTYGGGWTFAGTSNVIIDGSVTTGTRDLTIQYDQTQTYSATPTYGAVINLTPGTDSLVIKNCVIKSMLDPAGAGGRYNITVQGDATVSASYITVDNCEMTQSARNIVVYTNISSSGPVTGNMGRYWNITNNYIHDVLDFGMYLSMIYGCNVTDNTITNVRTLVTEGSNRTAGIYMAGFNNLIKNNKISNILNQKAAGSSSTNVAFGIHNRFPVAFAAAEGLSGVFAGYNPEDPWLLGWAGYQTKNRFIQNTISEVRSNVTALNWRGTVGLACWGGRFDSVLHNTISFDGAGTAGDGGNMGLYFQGSGLHSFRIFVNNNIISMNRVNGNTNTPLFTWNVFDDYRYPSDYNVYYHPYGPVMDGGKGQANCANLYNDYGYGTDGHSLDLNPHLMGGNDLHLDGTQPSAADGNGSWSTGAAGFYHVPNDLDAVARATPPDIGAYEGSSTGVQTDVGLLSLDSPGASGAPDGLVFTPITVTAQNFGYTNVTGVVVSVDIYDPAMALVYSDTRTVDIDAFSSVSTDMGLSWTPSGAGGYTFTCKATLAGDANAANDQIDPIIPVAGMKTLPYTSGFENAGEQDGWFGSNDWGLASIAGGDTKLGGAHAGDASYQTVPGPAGTHYTEVTLNNLYTPYFDFSTVGPDVYLSFYHSIELEPEWDRSIMEYSIDTGKTWSKLGVLNEPSPAINWYSSAVYQNAAGVNGNDCYDEADSPNENLALPGFWTSNGDCMGDDLPTGPNGFVYVQVKVPADAIGKTYVRFRYAAWSDYTSFDGWAFDDFRLSETPNTFPSKNLSGSVYLDVDGSSSINLGDTKVAGSQVDIQYFGVHMAYATTDPSGDYTYALSLPGDYTVIAVPVGAVTDYPVGGYTFNFVGAADITGQDFAIYVGRVSGKVYEDANNSGSFNTGDPLLSGRTIEVWKDAVETGTLVSSVLSATGTGAYEFFLAPYPTYVIREILPVNTRIIPATPYTAAVAGISGSIDITGLDFGNFLFSQTTMEALVDLNGDGEKGLADFAGIPAGAGSITWNLMKGADPTGVVIATDVLGDGLTSILHNLDAGYYRFIRTTDPPAGWVMTTHVDTFSVTIANSQQTTTFSSLYFKNTNLEGNVVEDLNGNGTVQLGEGPLAGWTISLVKGATTLTAVTNALGNYYFTNIGPGPYAITETVPAGWTRTFGVFAAAMPTSANVDNVNSGYNFGNFKDVAISGVLFRDRNNDGVKDAGEEGISGWDVVLTPGTTVATGTNGEFTFTAGPRPAGYALALTVQSGYTCTLPVGASYTVAVVSGTDQTGKNFGAYKGTDGTTYRTFTYEQLSAASEAKPIKYKAGKAIVGAPNTANLIDRLVNTKIGGTYAFQVGIPSQLNAGGKEKAYLKITKQGDAYKSFSAKGTLHTGAARAFDFNNKGGLMLKLWKKMGADKKNDMLVAQLLTLQVNLAASLNGNTDAAGNLGALIVSGTGPWGTDQTIDQIADYADGVMTNWEGVPFSVYTDLYTTVKFVNEAFAGVSVGDTTVDGGWTSAKLKWVTTKTVFEVTGLKSAVAPAKNRLNNDPDQLPEVYALGQNYPNPFNPTTSISFDLPSDAIVTLKIFNVLGQEVATVLNRQEFSSGTEEVDFDASSLASGVYLYQIVAEELDADGAGQTFTQVKKMMLMK